MKLPLKVIAIFGAILLGFAAQSKADAPRIEKGVLDLREWDFARDGWITLRGEMPFFWNNWIDPREPIPLDKSDAFASLSQSWTKIQKDGVPLPAYGYASYGLTILLPESEQDLAIEIGGLMSASRVFVAGEQVYQAGTPSRDPSEALSAFYSDVTAVGGRSGKLQVVFHISNWDFFRPGDYAPLYIGLKSQLITRFQRERFAGIGVIGATFIIALYHFMLFLLRRKDPIHLYFGISCFFQTFYASSILQTAHFLFPDAGAETAWKLLHIGWFISISAFSSYHGRLFPLENSGKFSRVMLVLSVLSALCVAAMDIRHYQYLGQYWTILSIAIVAYTVVKTWQSLRAGRDGIWICVCGVVVLGITVVDDLMVTNAIVLLPVLSPYGIFFYSCAQALLLSKRSAKVFHDLETSEREIRSLNQSILEQEQVRTTFFHNVSHELRTPLHGILGFVDLLTKGRYGALPAGVNGQVGKIGRLAEALRLQVNTILDLARFKKGEITLSPSLVPLQELAEETQILAEGLVQNRPAISFAMETSWGTGVPPSFVGDRDKIMTLLRNLLGNACKFSAPDRHNHVTCRLLTKDHETLVVEIEDQGIGIDPANFSVIFEEFRQVEENARRAYEGTGLGLTLVKSIVEAMGGIISIESQLGRGSLFRVTLPSASGNTSRGHLTPAVPAMQSARAPFMLTADDGLVEQAVQPMLAGSAPPTGAGARHILVIDDNPINCELIRDMIASSGYRVSIAVSGREGLAVIQQDRPHLILLDLMMPEMSGEDVLRKIQQTPLMKDIPVILMTARASQEDRLRGLALGADDYLAKPVMQEEILLRIKNTFSRMDLVAASSEKAALEHAIATAQSVFSILGGADVKIPGLDFSHYYRSAEQIGGDWFGLHHDKAASRLYVLIGDVTGHGMSSALLTIAVAGAFIGSGSVMKQSRTPPGLAEAMRLIWAALDQTVEQLGGKMEKAMTMALVGIDLESGDALYLNAGHPPVLRMAGGRFSALALSTHLLGMGDGNYEEPKFLGFSLTPGDLLFFYTDGLFDNAGPEGRTLRLRGLRAILENATDCHAAKDAILTATEKIWHNQSPRDDTSFLIMQWQRKTSASSEDQERVLMRSS